MWLWEESHIREDVSSNPSDRYNMDIFSQYYVGKIELLVLKRPK